MKRMMFVVFLLLVGVSAALAEGGLPPGKWWRQSRVVEHLGLTDEQQGRLDAIFRENASELIDLKAEVEKRNLVLRSEMDEPQVNRQDVQRAAASLSQARARLFERELLMFVDMRSVLSVDQWNRFRQVLDARENMHRRPGRAQRPGPRPDRGRGVPQPPPSRP